VGGTWVTHETGEKMCKVFGGKIKRPLGRPKCRWEDEIKMDLGLRMSSGFSWLKIESIKGCCKCGDKHSGSGATEFN
jgi:hypothetical protein